MSEPINWDAIGALGEIVGAIAVVATLAYLASQTRLNRQATETNTKALRSSIYQAYNNSAVATADHLAQNADIFVKLASGQELTLTEKINSDMFGNKLMAQMETVYLHYQEEMISEELFLARMKGFKRALSDGRLMETWQQFKHYDLTPSFVEYVDTQLIGGPDEGSA
jgi:hypothetical protein